MIYCHDKSRVDIELVSRTVHLKHSQALKILEREEAVGDNQ